MKKVDITVCRAQDGTYSAYCNEHPALFGMGSTAAKAKEELEETLRLTKEEGREKAFLYPDWLDEDYEFVTHWEVRTLLEYYSHGLGASCWNSSQATLVLSARLYKTEKEAGL